MAATRYSVVQVIREFGVSRQKLKRLWHQDNHQKISLDVKGKTRYIKNMIQGFKDKKTRNLYNGKRVTSYQAFAAQAVKRLLILDSADSLDALRMLPSNRFESLLGGNRSGYCSIAINKQWRICFKWGEAGPEDVEITDYH
ncbi:MAG: type II toxin-antitoxin system RelE/ParE family toxin [Desulfobacteraceae bacterium]